MDYAAVLAYLRHVAGLHGAELTEVFEGLQAAEHAVLKQRATKAGESIGG